MKPREQMPSKLTAVNIYMYSVHSAYSHSFAWREVVVFLMKLGADEKGLCPEEALEVHSRESCLRKGLLSPDWF